MHHISPAIPYISSAERLTVRNFTRDQATIGLAETGDLQIAGGSSRTPQTDIQKWQKWGMTAEYHRSDPASRRPSWTCDGSPACLFIAAWLCCVPRVFQESQCVYFPLLRTALTAKPALMSVSMDATQ